MRAQGRIVGHYGLTATNLNEAAVQTRSSKDMG